MELFVYIIQDPIGIHARPASKLVKHLSQFSSKVKVSVADREANAKSIINLMALGIKKGSEITFTIEGDDEAQLKDSLPGFLKEANL